MLEYRFAAGEVHRYSLQMRVSVQIGRGTGEDPVSQVAELAGELVLTVDTVDDEGAVINVSTHKLQGEVPSDGFFGEAAVGDPLAAIPERIRVGRRGEADRSAETERDATEGTLDALFPPLPSEVVTAGDTWLYSSAEDSESDPLVVHGRCIGTEPGDDGVARMVLGTFSGHSWSAGEGMDGVSVHGETKRMTELTLREADSWAHRVDARVESTLRIAAEETNAGDRTIQTTVEMLLEVQD